MNFDKEKEMREALNQVTIEGILSEVSCREGKSPKTGKDYISAEIKVRVEQEINGVTKENEVPIRMFATKITNSGSINPAYESIYKMKEEFTSIAASDVDSADRVRLTGKLASNDFYSKSGSLISYPIISASFINRINKEDMHPQALYHGVIVVGNTKDEVGKDGDPTGRMVLTGIIPQYGNRVDVVKFIVENEKAKNHIETYYSKGDTVEVQAKLNFSTKTTYEEVEMGFGDPIVRPRTESVREIIIVSGSEGGLEGELAYEKEAIDTALQRRKEYLASQKEVSEKTEKKKSTPSFSVDDF